MAANDTVANLLSQTRLVGIIRLDDLSQAVALSSALLRGGIRVQEYTLSNPAALQAIVEVRAAVKEFSSGEAVLGVGSIRELGQAEAALAAEVDFMVTPTLNPTVIRYCCDHQTPIMSGAFTPTEIATAWDLGSTTVKVFPARALGPAYIKDLLAPMPELQLMPTGGVSLENIPNYLAAGAAAVGVGGSLIDQKAMERGDWDTVSRTAEQYARSCASNT